MSTIRAATETTSLGRYRVVKRLAAGGMADVLLARTDGIEGFERHVVIKRIHPELLEEDRYIKMFLDEARLAAALHHHNIVQVNDIGQEDGKYFFAMEYVHGEDARNLLVTANQRGEQIPLEHVVTIITGAAAGLHHAHEQCGPDRSPLHIVHRDVSPANILVGFDGSVKVADFGIASAAHRAEHTQSGVLKGKVAYMSPEQCNCERVDRRSDVYSLGIVLYELVTVHPCFAGENDFMTMSAIVAGRFVPPSQLNPAVTPELEAIITKALASAPADRYQTADELRMALEHYAATASLRNSTTGLADYMKRQFGTRALPWLDDADDEPEISIAMTGSSPSIVIVDDELAVPIERPSQRLVKQTLPLRPVKSPESVPPPAIAAVPAIPRAVGPERTRPRVVAAAPRVAPIPAPEPVIATAPVPNPPTPTQLTRTRAPRRWWLASALVAVLVGGASLAIVSLDRDRPRPASHARPRAVPAAERAPSVSDAVDEPASDEPASDEPASDEPASDESAIAEPEASSATAADPAAAAPTRTKRSRRTKAKSVTAPGEPSELAPGPKWNPDTLFPK